MEYRMDRNIFGKVTGCRDFRMKISVSFDLTPAALEDVVIHEMIHYFIALRNLRDTSAHGELFRGMMNRINADFGRNITVSHKGAKTGDCPALGNPGGSSPHYFCISTFVDGNIGITVSASTKVFELNRSLPRCYDLAGMEWYRSCDPFFDRFPRSRTPKIYRITRWDLDLHMEGAIRYGFFDGIFRPED